MRFSYNFLWTFISIILIFLASIFIFYLSHNFYYFIQNKNMNYISCLEIQKYYNENINITLEGYLANNCTINNITIPEGYRVIKIENRNIYYI